MLKFAPHNYQKTSIDFIIDNEASGLFLDMGLGKTVITLTAIDHLIYKDLDILKVLVVAPKKVAENVWDAEILKWEHLKHLRISKVLGTEKKRKLALQEPADIYIINRENIVWLIGQYGGNYLPFDMLVIDELSSFKNHKSQRFKALRMVRPSLKRVVGLTGTPAPNGLINLWSQVYLLDRGERLGKTITSYRDNYFKPGLSNGNIVYKYNIKDGCSEVIQDKIRDICISLKAEDWLDLPKVIYNYVDIYLSDEVKRLYDEFELEQILELIESEVELTALSAAALTNKLLQFSNGAVYYEDEFGHKDFVEIHDEKIEALKDIIEDANGQPILIAYSFKHDLKRLMKALKPYGARILINKQDEDDWNAGKIPLLITHPASAGHGLNLQYGGHICVWFGITWDLELYQQFNKRLHRQGQAERVIIHHLISKGTEDLRVIQALQRKGNIQNILIEGLKAKVEKFKQLLTR